MRGEYKRYPVDEFKFNAYPEYTEYRDTGCKLFPACLACPLPRCRYDDPDGYNRAMRNDRDANLRVMLAAGANIDDVAKAFGVSRRSVFRIRAAAP